MLVVARASPAHVRGNRTNAAPVFCMLVAAAAPAAAAPRPIARAAPAACGVSSALPAPARGAALVAASSFATVPAVILDNAGEEELALPLPRAVESAADDPLLHNPLQRMERMGTGWFGVIADYEGVVVDSTGEVHREAWRQVAAEMDLQAPLGSMLNRINGVRDEVVRFVLGFWEGFGRLRCACVVLPVTACGAVVGRMSLLMNTRPTTPLRFWVDRT